MTALETTQPPAPARRSWLQRWLRPSAAARRRRLQREVWLITLIAAAATAFGLLWPADLENQSPWRIAVDLAAFMLRTFAFHVGLGLCCVAVVAWIIKQRVPAGVLLALAAAWGGPTVWEFIPRGASAAPPSAGGALRLLSVNLYAGNRQMETLTEEIIAADADVVLVQEYTPEWEAVLARRLYNQYPHMLRNPQTDCFGAAVFSRVPFVEPPRDELRLGPTGNPQLRVVVPIGGRPVAIYNIHLLPPAGLTYYRIGREEFVDLQRALAAEKLPAIVSGDFNFTSNSPQGVAMQRAGFRDALDAHGWGPRWTWPTWGLRRFIPGIRIDHIYVSPALTARESRIGDGVGSDHRPVFAEIALR